jgi:hypothetical protein
MAIPLINFERVVKMAKKINGYTVEFIEEYRGVIVEDAIQNALGAELAGMPETAEYWDILAEEYKNRTSEEITFKMIMRGVRRDG